MVRLTISFEQAVFTRNDPRDKFDLLLGVDATLSVATDDRSLFSEEQFAIVELRMALNEWSAAGLATDFEFDSIESDEHPLIWIRRNTDGQWRVGSVLLGLPDSDAATSENVLLAVNGFIAKVDEWVRRNLDVEVADVVR